MNTIHSCSLNFLCIPLQHEPDVELQNCEDRRLSRSYQPFRLSHGTAAVINVEGYANAHCLYVVSSPDSKLFIVESNLYTASDLRQSAHCVKARFTFCEHTIFFKVFYIEIRCKVCSLHHECYILMSDTDMYCMDPSFTCRGVVFWTQFHTFFKSS